MGANFCRKFDRRVDTVKGMMKEYNSLLEWGQMTNMSLMCLHHTSCGKGHLAR